MKGNKYLIFDDYAEIIISSEKFGIFNIKIDLKNIEKCKAYTWCVNEYSNDNWGQKPIYYVVNNKVGFLHRFIMNCPKGKEIDHIDMNTFNCIESNMRIVTHSQNQMNRGFPKNNTSGKVGVTWDKSRNKWIAFFQKEGMQKTVGYFKKKEDAIQARELAEIEYFEEYRNSYMN